MSKRVRAIIIKDGKVLLVHRIKDGQEYWTFPGGGLEELDNTPVDGLKRECIEELGVEVKVGDLFFEQPSLAPKSLGDVELFYKCDIVNGKVGTGIGPEFSRNKETYGTYKVEWLPLLELKDKNVYPLILRDKIIK